jgi:hypothetical protein
VIFDHSYDSNTTSVQYLDVLGSVCKVEETIKTKCWSIKRCVNAVRVGVDVKILSSCRVWPKRSTFQSSRTEGNHYQATELRTISHVRVMSVLADCLLTPTRVRPPPLGCCCCCYYAHRTALQLWFCLLILRQPSQWCFPVWAPPPPVVSSCNFTTFLSFSILLSQVNLTVKRTNKTKRRTQRKWVDGFLFLFSTFIILFY